MKLSLLAVPKNQKEFDSEVRYAISCMAFLQFTHLAQGNQ